MYISWPKSTEFYSLQQSAQYIKVPKREHNIIEAIQLLSIMKSFIAMKQTLLHPFHGVAMTTSDFVEASTHLDLSSDFIYCDPDTGALIPMNGTIEVWLITKES